MKGFTLIETLIYAALISVVIGFSLMATYQIIDGSEKLNEKINTEEEAGFLLKKIEWSLIGAETVISPLSGATSSVLSVNKANFPDNSLVFDLDSYFLRLKRGAGTPVILNSQNVKIANLVFEHLAADGNKPAGIKTSFYADEKPYEITVYLRK
jgi:hypothetical protein